VLSSTRRVRTAGGAITIDRLLLGGTKTFFTDLARFSRMVLSRARSSMCAIYAAHESALHTGMKSYESSACLSIEFPGVAAWRSEAVTTD